MTTITPRLDGDPVADLLALQLAHRAMRGDLHRLTTLVQDVAARRRPPTHRRAAAVREYLDLLCESIHHHHSAEDDVLWPVIEASAGAHVDLADLSDDHAQLDPKLDAVRTAAAAFAAHPESEDAASTLALHLARIRDLLDEHIEEEERVVFPVIERYVSVADWHEVEDQVRRRGRISFELPRIAEHGTPAEMATLRAAAGPLLMVMLRVLTPSFRRRERRMFG